MIRVTKRFKDEAGVDASVEPYYRRRKTKRDGRDACKLTLEVQDDNTRARILYRRFGFEDFVVGGSAATRFLAKKLEA
jgi:hypothetical protein